MDKSEEREARVTYEEAQRILTARRLEKDLAAWKAIVRQWGTMERLQEYTDSLKEKR